MQKKSRIVAVIGAKAAGKDELADYLLQQHHVPAIEIGAFARELAEESDPHMRYDVSSRKLAEYDPEYVIYRLVAEIMKNDTQQTNRLVVTGVRTPAEAAVLKDNFNSDLMLVFVKVGNPQTRYERTQNRDFTTDAKDLHEFMQQDEQLKNNYALAETAVLADTILWNNGSLDTFCQQIETHIVPHLFPDNQPGAS